MTPGNGCDAFSTLPVINTPPVGFFLNMSLCRIIYAIDVGIDSLKINTPHKKRLSVEAAKSFLSFLFENF
jgi:hypothetical protein